MANLEIKKLTLEAKPFWEDYFKKYILTDNYKFSVKLCYDSKELKELCVRLYDNELELKNGIFIELIDWDEQYFEHPQRKLYKYNYDQNWETKYPKGSNSSYVIPIKDLVLCSETTNITQKEELQEEIKIEQEVYDPPMSTMTLRDYAAIHLAIPCSQKEWLNKIINGREKINLTKNNN